MFGIIKPPFLVSAFIIPLVCAKFNILFGAKFYNFSSKDVHIILRGQLFLRIIVILASVVFYNNTPIYLRITLSTRNSFAYSMSRFRSLSRLETYVFRMELKSCASILLRLLIRSQIVRSRSYIGIIFPSLSFTMIFPTSSNSRFTVYTLQLPSAVSRCAL